MYGTSNQSEPIKGILRPQSRSSRHLRTKTSKARAHASCTFLSRAILTFPRGRGGGPFALCISTSQMALVGSRLGVFPTTSSPHILSLPWFSQLLHRWLGTRGEGALQRMSEKLLKGRETKVFNKMNKEHLSLAYLLHQALAI